MHNRNFHCSKILSYIFHPILIPTLVIIALMLRADLHSIVLPNTLKLWFISVVFAYTVIIPGIGVYLLRKFNAINSFVMSQRNERIIPLLIASTSFVVMLLSVRSNNIPPLFMFVLYSTSITLMAGLLISLLYNISIYTLGWSALTAIFTGVSIQLGFSLMIYILISILISGIVGFIQLKQNAHNQTQVYLGYVAGVCIIFLISLLG